MRWRGERQSENVEDVRHEGGARRVPMGMKMGGGMTLLLLVVGLLLGQNPLQLLQMISQSNVGVSTQPQTQPRPAGNDEASQFVSVILASTEDVWGKMFSAAGQQYPAPKLVLFSDGIESACGMNSSATGPFYCPGDQKVYLDLSFLSELQRMGAAGDFAVAYVIAHEVGHHIQNVIGTERKFRQYQSQVNNQEQANALSVLMELQADCYAGVWANHAHSQRQILEEGDVEEGLNAAAAIGDDRLQKMAGRRVNPDGFTHGSSQQRVQWFRTGMKSGDINSCDTFKQAGL
ncbi:MAG: flagellar biosynthesis protein FlgM [Deltaproteobacteria bacterium]|nr:flagellar biosynthesis protein FlgM [Deltaproteobacteria bacterium]